MGKKVKLKPCPFCGGEVEIMEPYPKNSIGRAVLCKNCDLRAGWAYCYDDIMVGEIWNRRVGNQ